MNAAADTRAAAPTTRRPSIDAASIMRIKDLQLRARVVVEGFFNGLHRSPFHGFSAEFSEYRQYSPGDDTRFVDWRLYARSDRYYIKRFEDETNRRCYLLVDFSRSMAFGSQEYTKSDYARTLAATLAYYLTLQRDCVGLLTYDEQLRDFLPARYRTGHLRNMMGLLEQAEQGSSTNMVLALEQIASLIKKRGLVVILSDFLTPVDQLRRPLSYLRSRGHEVMALRVLDPSEVTFRFSEATVFRDLESRRPMYIDPHVARHDYLERFEQHREALREVCISLGIDLTQMLTDESFERALFHWLAYQVRQSGTGAMSRRGGAAASGQGAAMSGGANGGSRLV
jgi:uncharacterized protein (DUF58 family)